MFRKVAEFFRGEAELSVEVDGRPTSADMQIAAAVVLLEVANSDCLESQEEQSQCLTLLEKFFGSTEDEASMFLGIAHVARREVNKLEQVLALINRYFSLEQRSILFSMIWKVILADSVIHNDEQRLARQLGNSLKLSKEEVEEAKTRAFDAEIFGH